MAAIAELIPADTFPEQDEMQEEHEEIHAFWGDPPDVATCDAWIERVRLSISRYQEALTLLKTPGSVVTRNGTELHTKEHKQAARTEIVERMNKRYRRLRDLRAWKAERARDTWEANRVAKEGRSANGYAIKAAMKRYGQLENVMDALLLWLDEDSDETWGNLLEAVNEAQGGEG